MNDIVEDTKMETATATPVAAPKRKAKAAPAAPAAVAAKPAKTAKVAKPAPVAAKPTKAAKTAPKAAAKSTGRPKADLIEQNGIRRPRPEGLTGQAWAIFDSETKRLKRAVTAKEAKTVAETKGLNLGMVGAQYYSWRKFNGIEGRAAK
jgi:hypothetical protein